MLSVGYSNICDNGRFLVPTGLHKEASSEPGVNSHHVPLEVIKDLRLPPGLPMAASEEYWSAAYLFWLEPGQKVDAHILQKVGRILNTTSVC